MGDVNKRICCRGQIHTSVAAGIEVGQKYCQLDLDCNGCVHTADANARCELGIRVLQRGEVQQLYNRVNIPLFHIMTLIFDL